MSLVLRIAGGAAFLLFSLGLAGPASAQTPDFTVTVDPPSNTALGGQADVFYTVSVAATGGFSDPVDLSCSDLPTDASCQFTPASVTPGSTSQLKFVTAQTTPVGTTLFTVTGTSGSITNSGTASITVTPSFIVVAAPASQAVTKGGSTEYSVAVLPVGGAFDEPVRLLCLGPLPAGVTCAFNPNQVTPGANGASSVLTVHTTDPDTPDGTYNIGLRGVYEAEQYSRDTAVELAVNGGPDFTVTVDPPSNTALGGQADVFYTVSVAATGGFSDPVNLSCSDLPTDASCQFTPASVTPGSTSQLRFVTAQTTPVGTTLFTVTGTSGSITNSGPAIITVTPSFTVAAAPASQAVTKGGSTEYSVAVTPVNGAFDEPVRLICLGPLPAGVTCAFNPNQVTPGASGASSVLTVHTTDPDTPDGTYNIGLRGNYEAEQYSRDTAVELAVGAAPDFTVTVDPPSNTALGGQADVFYTVSVAATGGFSDPVDLSCSDLPTDASCQFTPASVTPGSTSQLKFVTAQTTPVGTTLFTVTGTSGSITNSGTASITVTPSFTVEAAPASQSVTKGGSTEYSVAVTPVNGAFDEPVRLICLGPLPAGVTCAFDPNQVTPGANGAPSVLTVSTTDPDTPEGTYNIGLRGNYEAEQYSRDTAVELAVGAAPDFTVTLDPTSNTAAKGQSATYTVSVAGMGGFSDAVALSCSDLPTDASCTFNPASVAPGNTSELTVATAASTPSGTTDFTVTGTAGSLTNSETATLAVEDFTIAIGPASATVAAGSAADYTVTVTPDATAGFSSAVTFACSGLPSGASCAFSPTTVTPNDAAATTTVTVSTAATLAANTSAVTGQDALPFGSQKLAMLLFALPVFGIVISAAGKGHHVTALRRFLLIVALIGVGVQFSACDSPSEPAPEPEPVTTTFTVTATGDGIDRTDTATITVNP